MSQPRIKDRIKKYVDTNENENTMACYIWDAAKPVLRGTLLTIQI